MDLTSDPEPFHEVAIACYAIAFVTVPTDPNFAVEVGALGITLDAIASRLERAAAVRKATRPRAVRLQGRSMSTTRATVQLEASVDAKGRFAANPRVLADVRVAADLAAVSAINADLGRKMSASLDFRAINAIKADFGRKLVVSLSAPVLALLRLAPLQAVTRRMAGTPCCHRYRRW